MVNALADIRDSRVIAGGVQRVPGGYEALLSIGGEIIELGTRPTLDEAAELYDEAERRTWG